MATRVVNGTGRLADWPAELDDSSNGGASDSSTRSLRERLVAIEASMKDLWKVWPMAMTFISLLFIIATAWTTWQLTSLASRMESGFESVDRGFEAVDRRVDAIPDRLTDIANAIATNVTAAKQPNPIVIYSQPAPKASTPPSPPPSR